MIGLLHPGEMGSAVGGRLLDAGHDVGWVPGGRSAGTRGRAEAAGFVAVESLGDLVRRCDVVLSICPPYAAVEVAEAVARERFAGLYVDANAIAPDTTRRVAESMTGGGARFVDGGIVGAPPVDPGATRLYLSGESAPTVAALFVDTVVEAVVVDDRIGSASAVKMTYAAWTKGYQALVLAIHAVAEHEGVDAVLREEWARSLPDLDGRLRRAGSAASRKGWRWVGEMEQIAKTFAAADAPAGFHEAAAQIYRRYPRT